MNAVVAVHSATCDVLSASRVAVTGRSGSGKSTLLHLMAGLETPTAGVISWPGLGGSPLSQPGRVGLIFQGPSLLPALSGVENVMFPLLLARTDEQEARDRAWEALRILGIVELATKLPQELSGGQAQRVAIARVMASRPALILADEPTGQLDFHTAAHVMDVLLGTADDISAGLVVSTHDPRIAGRLPTRWRMRDGRLTDVPVGAPS
jgi:putative ABC transport system ATP-binding protein